jgi:hypothetical protein
MKTELTKLDHLMIISAVAGLILAAVAFLMPAAAEAAIPGPSNASPAGTAVAVGSPHGAIVQTGPRTFRADGCRRPLPPLGGSYVWVPGHFERIREIRTCRQYHRPDQRPYRRTKVDHFRKHRRSPKSQRHSHYREVWVPGHWKLV